MNSTPPNVLQIVSSSRSRLSLEARYHADTDVSSVTVEHTSPERIVNQQDTLIHVVRALQQLPERTQRIFTLHRINGMTQKQIAMRLDISPTLVNFSVRHAADHCSLLLHDCAA